MRLSQLAAGHLASSSTNGDLLLWQRYLLLVTCYFEKYLLLVTLTKMSLFSLWFCHICDSQAVKVVTGLVCNKLKLHFKFPSSAEKPIRLRINLHILSTPHQVFFHFLSFLSRLLIQETHRLSLALVEVKLCLYDLTSGILWC